MFSEINNDMKSFVPSNLPHVSLQYLLLFLALFLRFGQFSKFQYVPFIFFESRRSSEYVVCVFCLIWTMVLLFLVLFQNFQVKAFVVYANLPNSHDFLCGLIVFVRHLFKCLSFLDFVPYFKMAGKKIFIICHANLSGKFVHNLSCVFLSGKFFILFFRYIRTWSLGL